MFYVIISLLTFFIGVYSTQYIAKQVAFYWRKREDDVQIKIDEVKEKKKEIEDVCKRMITFSSERHYCALTLIEYIQEKYSNQDIVRCRDLYRQSVQNWNIELQKIFLDMRYLGLQIEASEIEKKLHKALFDSHNYIKKYWQDNNFVLLSKAKGRLEESQNQTIIFSAILYQKAREQLFQIDGFYKEDIVSNEQLYQVSILKLIKFIFYRRKNFFCVN